MSLRPQLRSHHLRCGNSYSQDQIYSLVKESLLAKRRKVTRGDEVAHSRYAGRIDRRLFPAQITESRFARLLAGIVLSTKPEQHDVVRAFAKSLKPPFRLSLPALETLAVVAYKQPATVPEISEIRGVDSGGVIATLLDRKLITTAGRKAVIGRPILYRRAKISAGALG